MERRMSERKASMIDRRTSAAPGQIGGWSDCMNLSEAEKLQTIDRVLKSTNPNMRSTPVYFDFKKEERKFKPFATVDQTAVHFTLDGNSVLATSEEAKRVRDERMRREAELERAEEAERNPDSVPEGGVSTKILKNQFNYSDRASQTLNPPMRERLVITDPPPFITFNGIATQWEIFDCYEEDRQANERAAQASGKKKGAKDDDRGRSSRDAGRSENPDDVFTSPAYFTALKTMERMVNQNDSHDIIDDYKYWEDQSDLFKDDGNLLPLWKFHTDKVKKREVTCIAWNPQYTDLFAVGYGSYQFLQQGNGAVQCFTLKNAFPTASSGPSIPAFPEFFFQLDSGVMCMDFHPQQPALLACGLYDGSVCVFDLRQRSAEKKMKPIYQSTVKTGKHMDPVWEVRWAKQSSPTTPLEFFSISSDGRVTSWVLAKNELQFADVMLLSMGDVPTTSQSSAQAAAPAASADDAEAALMGLSGGTCFDFALDNDNVFIVGTEEGLIRRCSKAYNAQYLDTYEGHNTAVYAVRWNRFHPGVFLSCSEDWTVKLWEKSSQRPLMSFDLSSAVGDVVWAPYSSTVFAAVTADGKVHVFDLKKNKNEPLCAQAVVKNAKLNKISFNPKEPIILVGDARGTVLSLKLSPNLRQAPKATKELKAYDEEKARQNELDELNRIIAITLKDRELLEQNP